MPNMFDLVSTGLSRSSRLAKKIEQKYGLFSKLSLTVVGACGVDNNPHTFIPIGNQHIQKNNRKFDENLNHFGPMVFAKHQEQTKLCTIKDIFFQPDISYFILYMIR